MIVSKTSLEALRTGFRAEFQKGIGQAAPTYGPITTVVGSTAKIETYGFLGEFPVFRKWVGEKRVRSMAEKAYQLNNDDFEATRGIHKNKIRDDNLGLYGPLVQGWGQSAASLADKLAFDALGDGHTLPCYDGQNFFDDEHPIGDGGAVATNMSAAGGSQPWYLLDCSKPLKPLLHQERQKPEFHMVTDPEDAHVFKTGEYLMGGEARGAVGFTYWQLGFRSTQTLDAAGYQAACAAMGAFVSDEGEPLGVRPTHLVVGSSNVAAAKALIEAATGANGSSNIWFKDVAVIEAPRLP
ncbi:MAG: Mu-like prophage major head subunit gpT family protein [Caulobacteraceae bacterium]